MLPPGKSYGLPAEADFDPRTSLAAPDCGEAVRFGGRRQQLVVLTEAEILVRRSRGQWNELEIDRKLAIRASCEVAAVAGEPVREVEHRVRGLRELQPFLDPDRRARVPPFPKRCSGRAQRPGHHEVVSGSCPGAARDTLRVTQGGDREKGLTGPGGVPAPDRHVRLRDAAVELEHSLDLGLGRQADADEKRLGAGSRGGEVADVDRGGAEPELPPGEALELKVDAFDERILRDDEPSAQLGGVMLRALDEPLPLELGQQSELAELRQL